MQTNRSVNDLTSKHLREVTVIKFKAQHYGKVGHDDVWEVDEEHIQAGDDDVVELHEELIVNKEAPHALVPLENRGVSSISFKDERRLRNNYDIYAPVLLHFQNSITRAICGRDISIFKRMLLAGLRFPFSDITRELVLFSGCSSDSYFAECVEIFLCIFHPVVNSYQGSNDVLFFAGERS
jgi:hypothetical protein